MLAKITTLLTLAAVTSSPAFSTTVLHQVVTTTKADKPSREQATVTYLDGGHFRVERYADKKEGGDWSTLILFDGKQTINCRRTSKNGAKNSCRITSAGLLSELDAFLGTPGMKFSIDAFSFAKDGAAKAVAGHKCQPHKLAMNVTVRLDMGNLKLPGGFDPSMQGTILGTSCVALLPNWDPAVLASQLQTAKPLFTEPAAFDAFVVAAKTGLGFELEGDTTVAGGLGGSASIPELNSKASKMTTSVALNQPTLTSAQLKVPAGFSLAPAK